ncbi:MAG: hypothetical protein P4L40_08615 [Terracidiphilus sp.]|nr:hypothetical protein [Terracidiphilus sp.]
MAAKNQRDITVICRQSGEPCEEALRAAFAMLFHIGPDEQLPPAPPSRPRSADLTDSDEELTFRVITNH